MSNTCPGCGAVYNVTDKDVGRRLKCKKCHTRMAITEAGIEADDGAAAAPPPPANPLPDPYAEPDPAPARSRSLPKLPTDLGGRVEAAGGLSTLVFGFGAFLVIFHLFMPLIGDAKVKGRQASADEDRAAFEQASEKVRTDKDLKEADRTKKLDDLRKDFETDQKKSNERVRAAEISNRQSAYLDRYFMMFGFLLVMAGSLMFMAPSQPSIKRTVGAIVVTAQMVLVFVAFLGRSVSVG